MKPRSDMEIRAARLTHQWGTLDGEDYRCWKCDSKMWHRAADWPCGQEPPQLPIGKVPFETDGTGIIHTDTYESDRPDYPWEPA